MDPKGASLHVVHASLDAAVVYNQLLNAKVALGHARARDKAANVVQNACRLIVGLTGRAGSGTKGKAIQKVAMNMMSTLGSARRTFRFVGVQELLFIDYLVTLKACNLKKESLVDIILDLLQKAFALGFSVTDRIGWLQQINILPSKRLGTRTLLLSDKFDCLTSITAAAVEARRLIGLSFCPDWNEEDRRDRAKKWSESLIALTGHMCLVVNLAHLSKLRESNNRIAGACGVVAHCIGFLTFWPKEMPKEEKAPIKHIENFPSDSKKNDGTNRPASTGAPIRQVSPHEKGDTGGTYQSQ